MPRPDEKLGDPLIDDVRARRRALFESCGRDLRTFFELIERTQREHPEKLDDRRKRLQRMP